MSYTWQVEPHGLARGSSQKLAHSLYEKYGDKVFSKTFNDFIAFITNDGTIL